MRPSRLWNTRPSAGGQLFYSTADIVATGILSLNACTGKTIPIIASGILTVIKMPIKISSVFSTGLVVVIKQISITKALTAIGALTSGQSIVKFVSAALTATGVAALTKLIGKVMPTVVSGIVTVVKKPAIGFSTISTGLVAVTKQIAITKALTASGVLTSAQTIVKLVSAVLTATGIVALIKQVSLARSAVATGVVNLAAQTRKSFALIATGLIATIRQINITKALVATGVVTYTQTIVKLVSAVLTATGIVALTKQVGLARSAVATGVVNLAAQTRKSFAIVAIGIASGSAYVGMMITTYAKSFVAICGNLAFSARAEGLNFIAFAKKLFFTAKERL